MPGAVFFDAVPRKTLGKGVSVAKLIKTKVSEALSHLGFIGVRRREVEIFDFGGIIRRRHEKLFHRVRIKAYY